MGVFEVEQRDGGEISAKEEKEEVGKKDIFCVF
jgi:hypothetical protein